MNEVLKQMVEALEVDAYVYNGEKSWAAIKAGKQAIAELESQEPVATVTSETGADITMSWWHEPALPMGTKLFTHPPQRTWVGLTDEEIIDVIHPLVMADMPDQATDYEIAKAIEARLKELNT
jgi:hypothetical protein